MIPWVAEVDRTRVGLKPVSPAFSLFELKSCRGRSNQGGIETKVSLNEIVTRALSLQREIEPGWD